MNSSPSRKNISLKWLKTREFHENISLQKVFPPASRSLLLFHIITKQQKYASIRFISLKNHKNRTPYIHFRITKQYFPLQQYPVYIV